MAAVQRASTIREAWLACDLGPLSGDKLAWWADLSKARGAKPLSRLEAIFDLGAGEFPLHVAFTGHRGCGKSTELLRLKQQWNLTYFVVYFEVTELLDPNDIAFSDLFLTITMKLAQEFHNCGMDLDKRLLDNVERFAESVIKETTQEAKSQIEVGAKAQATGGIPFFAKLNAWITSQFKASTQHKETIRRIFERDITRLITDTNLLLDDARAWLKSAAETSGHGPTELMIILDNLDRTPPDVADRLVFQHGDFLKQLRANVIYTMPVSVFYSRKSLERVFPRLDFLPMVSVFKREESKLDLPWNDQGVDAMAGVVEQRIETATVFDDRELVRELARYSGGCLRHLMLLTQLACESAHARRATRIGPADVEDALREMQTRFERMIPPEYYPVLREVARTKAAPNSDLGREALYNLSLLEYNGGKRWNYVHPLVRRIERFAETRRGKGAKAKGRK
ncbi:MAG: ATP-binding protein [Planctomycetes bacterium]|nr:ATP-binding protein [Planctomycetota bacterium]